MPIDFRSRLRVSRRGWGALAFAVVGLLVTVANAPACRGTAPAEAPPPPVATIPGSVELLADQAYEPRLLALLDQARTSIDITMFSIVVSEKAGAQNAIQRLIDLLAAKVKAGVRVRIVVDKGIPANRRFGDDSAPSERAAGRLAALGVPVRWDEESRTTHTKSLVVDGRWCVVGSHNWSVSALRYNREQSLLLDSPVLAGELTTRFNALWDLGTPVAGPSSAP